LVSDGEHYGLSKKTKHRKGEQMKRLALLSVVSLMLASAVFAPVAMAQEPAEVDVQSVTLGPGGSVIVTGTIECIEGYHYNLNLEVRQRTSGNVYMVADPFISGMCETTGPQAFTVTAFGERPFHGGPASITTLSSLVSPDGSDFIIGPRGVEAIHLSR
jgi:hypothetical protein